MSIQVRIPQLAPVTGLKQDQPSDELDEGYSPRSFNVRFVFQSVREGPGRSLLAGNYPTDPIRRIARFSKVDGTAWAISISDKTLFRWGGVVPGTPRQWHAVPGPVLLTTALFDITSGEDQFFFTRYNEPVTQLHYWDGDISSNYAPLVADFGIAPPCKFVEYFNNRLICGYVYENVTGERWTNRIKWSVNGDFRDWAGVGSGFLDFYDPEEEPITGIKVLGARLALYRKHSITDVIATGQQVPVHESEVRVSGVGCSAPYTIASTGLQHFFLSSDNSVYSWDGTQVRNIGEPIKEELKALINETKLELYFGFISLNTQEYFLVLTTGDVFVYNYVYNTWTRDTYGNITAANEVLDSTPVLQWDTAPGTWDQMGSSWTQLEATTMPKIFAGRSDGGTFVIDEQVVYDYYTLGSIVDRFCETRDHYFPSLGTQTARSSLQQQDPYEDGTIQRVMFIYEYTTDAEPFLFGVSMDKGNSWIEREIFPTPANFSIAEFNICGRPVRFRMRSNNANQRFKWSRFSYEFIPAGPTTTPG